MGLKRSSLILFGFALVAIILIGVLFWPTLYRYERMGQTVVRIRRVTGEAAILSGSSWVTREKPREVEPLPIGAQSKVTGNAGLSGFGSFSGKLYNGSDWTITRAVFRVVAKEANGKTRWDRQFATQVYVTPLSASSFYVSVTGDGGVSKTEWYIEELGGYPPK